VDLPRFGGHRDLRRATLRRQQVTDSIVTFAIDAGAGRLRPTGTPACIILRETAPHP
jgi:hypothetical protein